MTDPLPPPDAPGPFRRRDGLTVAVAVGAFGAAFGVFAVATGFSVAQAQVMSVFVFTGGSQFAAVGVISSGGTPAAAFASAGLLAARNAMYGLALHPVLRGGPMRRLLAAHLVIDESTAMAVAQQDPAESEKAFWFTGVAVLLLWNLGTLAGAVGGNTIGDPGTYGLDAAFPAGFVALMAPHLRKKPGLIAAVSGGLIALFAIPLVPAGAPILLAGLGVVPASLYLWREAGR